MLLDGPTAGFFGYSINRRRRRRRKADVDCIGCIGRLINSSHGLYN